mgnify:CR=1 FL=1
MKRLARRLLQKQMLAAVASADVVVTNPTHYAVALKYERGRDQAPVVLAKGENQFARRIKALAAAHGVPHVRVATRAELDRALAGMGTRMVEVVFDRSLNVAAHDALNAAVVAAVDAVTA